MWRNKKTRYLTEVQLLLLETVLPSYNYFSIPRIVITGHWSTAVSWITNITGSAATTPRDSRGWNVIGRWDGLSSEPSWSDSSRQSQESKLALSVTRVLRVARLIRTWVRGALIHCYVKRVVGPDSGWSPQTSTSSLHVPRRLWYSRKVLVEPGYPIWLNTVLRKVASTVPAFLSK